MTGTARTYPLTAFAALLLLLLFPGKARGQEGMPQGWYGQLDALSLTTGFPGVTAGWTGGKGWSPEISAGATWLLVHSRPACAEHVTVQFSMNRMLPIKGHPGMAWTAGAGAAAGYYDFGEGEGGSQGQYAGLTASLSWMKTIGENTWVRLGASLLAGYASDNPYKVSPGDGRLLWQSRRESFFVAPAAVKLSIMYYFKTSDRK